MKSGRKIVAAVLLVLVMVTCLVGCGKKEEEKATRRERRERNEKNENNDQENDVTDIPTAAPATSAPVTEITPAEAENTPIPTEVVTSAPAAPVVYFAEFNSLDDLKFIRSEILGKDLKDVLDIIENKYNIPIIRDSAIYSIQQDYSNVRFELENPGVKVLGNGGFSALYISYGNSKNDSYNGFVRDFEFCLNRAGNESQYVVPELAEKTYSSLYTTFSSALGEPDYDYDSSDDLNGGNYSYQLWYNKTYGNVFLCGGTDMWSAEGYNECLLSFGLDPSDFPLLLNIQYGCFYMDESLLGLNYSELNDKFNGTLPSLTDWEWDADFDSYFDYYYEGNKYAFFFYSGVLKAVRYEVDGDIANDLHTAYESSFGEPTELTYADGTVIPDYETGFGYKYKTDKGELRVFRNFYDNKQHIAMQYSIDVDTKQEVKPEKNDNIESGVSTYFTVDKKGFFQMDTSIWNVSYSLFKTLMNTDEITELEDWPYWGTNLEVTYVKDGKYEYACLFQNNKLAVIYIDLDEKLQSKVYDSAVSEYGNPSNAYVYWSGFPAYEWSIDGGTYQQHIEVYDDINHFRQQYVSPDYKE
ncbi:MAG: hypothetical protein IK007_08015 [Lachnospiraceae bacterium]|nr:hypothetical protein [Lachnospiraceae bacterium]